MLGLSGVSGSGRRIVAARSSGSGFLHIKAPLLLLFVTTPLGPVFVVELLPTPCQLVPALLLVCSDTRTELVCLPSYSERACLRRSSFSR